MSIKSFHTPTSTDTRVKISQVESNSKDDIVNNIMVGSTYAGKVPKSMLGKFQTPKKYQKMVSRTENLTTSSLSPLAKVFVPQMSMMNLKGERIDGLRGRTNESQSTAPRRLPGAVE